MEKNKKITQAESKKVAEKSYEPEDYKKETQISSGLATTHEQASDTFVEGTIDGQIDDVNGEDLDLRRNHK